MRIDLVNSPTRPWPMRVVMSLVGKYVGTILPPPLFFSYRMDLIEKSFMRYTLRSTSTKNAWSAGEGDLFAAFVSNINACHF